MATASIPPVASSLGLSQLGQSVLLGVPVLCFGGAAFLGVRVRQFAGEERALTGLLITLAVGLLLRSIVGPYGLFAGTVIACSAIGLMNVLLPSLVHRRYHAHVGAITAAYTVALGVGGAIAAALTVPLSTSLHVSAQLAIGFWTLPAFAALVLWLRGLGHTRRPDGAVRAGGIGGLVGRRLAWLVTVFFGLQSFVYYAIFSWLPAVYVDRSVARGTAGLLLGLMNLTGIAGSFVAPVAALRLRDPRWAIVAVVTVISAGMLGVWLGPVALAPLWVVLIGVGQGGALSLALLLIIVRSADSGAAASLSSMAQSFGYLLAATGPLIFGALHVVTGQWTLSFVLLIAALIAEMTIGINVWRTGITSLASPAEASQLAGLP
jgi:CP family cyanate transporter-like MFS transporter